MYTVEALNDTKLTEVKQIAAELGITTVEDKRCKHLWVQAIISAQEVAPLPLLELLPAEAFVATPSASSVTSPEPEEDEEEEEDEMWEEEEESPDGEEERGPAPWDDPDDCLDDECLDDFQDAYEYFEYKGWIIYGDGDLSYQDPKTQVWEEWEYDRSLDDAIRELERHIDRIEFDRAVSPGQLQLDLFPTSEVQIANVSDSLTWEVAPLLVAELRDSCRAIDSDISIDVTEQSAIVPVPEVASEFDPGTLAERCSAELKRIWGTLNSGEQKQFKKQLSLTAALGELPIEWPAAEQSAIVPTPGVATEQQFQKTCSHCKGKGFIREDTSEQIHFWHCDRCDSTGIVFSSIDATERSAIVSTPGVATEQSEIVPTPGVATERSAIVSSPGVATERSAIVSTPGVATERSAIVSTPGVATEQELDIIATRLEPILATIHATEREKVIRCSRCRGLGRVKKPNRTSLLWPRCIRCNGAGSFLFVPSAITSARSPPGRVPK